MGAAARGYCSPSLTILLQHLYISREAWRSWQSNLAEKCLAADIPFMPPLATLTQLPPDGLAPAGAQTGSRIFWLKESPAMVYPLVLLQGHRCCLSTRLHDKRGTAPANPCQLHLPGLPRKIPVSRSGRSRRVWAACLSAWDVPGSCCAESVKGNTNQRARLEERPRPPPESPRCFCFPLQDDEVPSSGSHSPNTAQGICASQTLPAVCAKAHFTC